MTLFKQEEDGSFTALTPKEVEECPCHECPHGLDENGCPIPCDGKGCPGETDE